MSLERCENVKRQCVQCQLNCLWSLDRNNQTKAEEAKTMATEKEKEEETDDASTRMKLDSRIDESLWQQVK